jgi:hypothetical protein
MTLQFSRNALTMCNYAGQCSQRRNVRRPSEDLLYAAQSNRITGASSVANFAAI